MEEFRRSHSRMASAETIRQCIQVRKRTQEMIAEARKDDAIVSSLRDPSKARIYATLTTVCRARCVYQGYWGAAWTDEALGLARLAHRHTSKHSPKEEAAQSLPNHSRGPQNNDARTPRSRHGCPGQARAGVAA